MTGEPGWPHFRRGLEAVLPDDPLPVVEVEEGDRGGAQILDVAVDSAVDDLLLEGLAEASGDRDDLAYLLAALRRRG